MGLDDLFKPNDDPWLEKLIKSKRMENKSRASRTQSTGARTATLKARREGSVVRFARKEQYVFGWRTP